MQIGRKERFPTSDLGLKRPHHSTFLLDLTFPKYGMCPPLWRQTWSLDWFTKQTKQIPIPADPQKGLPNGRDNCHWIYSTLKTFKMTRPPKVSPAVAYFAGVSLEEMEYTHTSKGAHAVENSAAVPQKVKHRFFRWSSTSTPRDKQIFKFDCGRQYSNNHIHMLIAALFTIAERW